jgi:hypothetical protein
MPLAKQFVEQLGITKVLHNERGVDVAPEFASWMQKAINSGNLITVAATVLRIYTEDTSLYVDLNREICSMIGNRDAMNLTAITHRILDGEKVGLDALATFGTDPQKFKTMMSGLPTLSKAWAFEPLLSDAARRWPQLCKRCKVWRGTGLPPAGSTCTSHGRAGLLRSRPSPPHRWTRRARSAS